MNVADPNVPRQWEGLLCLPTLLTPAPGDCIRERVFLGTQQKEESAAVTTSP